MLYASLNLIPGFCLAGFVVSAKRKAADAFAAAGLADEASREREQAAALARRFGLFDQARRLDDAEP